MLSNKPFLLGRMQAFRENPFTVNILFPDDFTIDPDAAVEYWAYDAPLDVEIPVTIDGQSIQFTVEVETLRIVDEADLYITFGTGTDKLYKFHAPVSVSMDGSLPTSTTFTVNFTEYGPIQVSIWSDAASALEALAARNEAVAAAATATSASAAAVAAAADVSTRFQGFVDGFGQSLSDPANIEWIDTGGLVTGTTANGGTVNTTSRTISIGNGSTGRTANLIETFGWDNLPNAAVGDTVKLRLKLSESVPGTIDGDTVEIKLSVNGVDTPISYSFTPYGDSGLVYEAISSRTIGSLSDSLALKVAIKSDAPTQSPATIITWDTSGYYLDKYLFEQATDEVEQLRTNFYNLFPHIELPYTYALMDGGGASDVTGYMQDYVADALAKSGVVILKKGQNHYIATKVEITGGLEIKGNGSRFTPNTTEAFLIKTNSPLWIHDLTIQRSNTSVTATSFKFDSGFTNSGSLFERVNFINLPDHFAIDYAKYLTIRDCNLIAGQNGFKVGHAAPTSVSDVKLLRNTLDTLFVIAVSVQGANNFLAEENFIGTYSGSSFYTGRCFQINPPSGSHKNVHLINNFCEGFTEYAVRVATVSGVTLDGVAISGGRMRDSSPTTHLGVMRLSVASGSSMTDVNVHNTQLVTKATAIDMDGLTNAHLIGNNIRQHTGTFAGSRAYSITNSTYLSKGNTGVGMTNANVFTGSTLLTEI